MTRRELGVPTSSDGMLLALLRMQINLPIMPWALRGNVPRAGCNRNGDAPRAGNRAKSRPASVGVLGARPRLKSQRHQQGARSQCKGTYRYDIPHMFRIGLAQLQCHDMP